jgi:hypothetical protein
MTAIRIQSYGGLEVLRTTTLSDPDPGPDEVLVRIKASAVNPLDGIVRMGHFPIAKEPPLILGEEAAGIVDRNGGRLQSMRASHRLRRRPASGPRRDVGRGARVPAATPPASFGRSAPISSSTISRPAVSRAPNTTHKRASTRA